MNLILLSQSDFLPDTRVVRLRGRRQKHVLDVYKAKVGQKLVIGLENGLIGDGIVLKNDKSCLEMEVSARLPPPPKLRVVLAVAMMRPIVFKRVLQTAASMGVPEIMIFHSRRVEKSFWQSSALSQEAIREQLVLGLEQAKDTVLPRVSLHQRFKPFVEDVLSRILKERAGIVADPAGDDWNTIKAQGTRRKAQERPFPVPAQSLLGGGLGRGDPCALCLMPCALIVGPEGGFIPYEIERFKEAGCCVISMGERILRVETAVTALLARLF